jgi:hypothetical protein
VLFGLKWIKLEIARPASYRILIFGLIGSTEHSSVKDEKKKRKGEKEQHKVWLLSACCRKKREGRGNEAEGGGPYIITKPCLGGEEEGRAEGS